MHIDPKRVCLRINVVNLRRVFQLLQDVPRTHTPSVHFDGDEGGWVVVGLKKVVGVNVGGQVGCNQLRILAAGLAAVSAASGADRRAVMRIAYNDGAFTPAPVPVTADEADPVSLAPYASSDGYLGVELYTHLEIAFKAGFGDREGLGGGRSAALEAADHSIQVSFLGRLGRCVLSWGAIDGLM